VKRRCKQGFSGGTVWLWRGSQGKGWGKQTSGGRWSGLELCGGGGKGEIIQFPNASKVANGNLEETVVVAIAIR